MILHKQDGLGVVTAGAALMLALSMAIAKSLRRGIDFSSPFIPHRTHRVIAICQTAVPAFARVPPWWATQRFQEQP
jgi:hypothetical protein